LIDKKIQEKLSQKVIVTHSLNINFLKKQSELMNLTENLPLCILVIRKADYDTIKTSVNYKVEKDKENSPDTNFSFNDFMKKALFRVNSKSCEKDTKIGDGKSNEESEWEDDEGEGSVQDSESIEKDEKSSDNSLMYKFKGEEKD